MENAKTLAMIVYYLALSITGPLALLAFIRGRKADRMDREYRTYDELDNRFFEYQKLALEYYDLDILDVPNNDPSLAFDKKRKQEMVAHAILFSLFERAYIMFVNQGDSFQRRQWSGWKRFLDDFIRREPVRAAWQASKATYDTEFQAFMDKKIHELLSSLPTPPVAVLPAIPVHHPVAPHPVAPHPVAPIPAAIPVSMPLDAIPMAEPLSIAPGAHIHDPTTAPPAASH